MAVANKEVMKQRSVLPVLVLLLASGAHAIGLERLTPRIAEQGWGALGINKSVSGGKLRVGDKQYNRGLGTHARSDLLYLLGGGYERFSAFVGMDAYTKDYPRGSVRFQAYVDGKVRFDSGIMRPDTPAQRVDISVHAAQTLRLVVTDGGDGIYADHANWCEPTLTGTGPSSPQPAAGRVAVSVRTKGISIGLTKDGQIAGFALGSARLPWAASTSLFGARSAGKIRMSRQRDGEIRFIRPVTCGGRRCVITESFRPTSKSIRWSATVHSESKNWSTPVDTHLALPDNPALRFWTAWGHTLQWEDPFVPKPLRAMTLNYGGFFTQDDGFSLPLFTLLVGNKALSLVESPDDTLIEMKLSTARTVNRWDVALSRGFLRMGGKDLRFQMDFVPHPADPRCALGWMVERYPAYFNPPNPRTHEVGGGGAYSGYEGPLDAAKFHAMGFSMNWKASLDFPYMGLFLPPVASDTEEWNRFPGGGGGGYGPGDEGRFGKTSLRQMSEYSQRMRAMGFHVLNYFNVTEFGGNIDLARVPSKEPTGGWGDPTAFLFDHFPAAVLRAPDPIGTWGGAVVTDCGAPAYRRFLLEQARRHIEELPYSDGICIDRMDWLSRFNPRADDGVTWVEGPRRSLLRSWMGLLSEMGPMMRKANKVIFVNCMIQRPDLMRHVDGVYDEFGFYAYKLNLCSFLCLRKPLVCWTPEAATLQPNPDAYFQRHLYMGAFPTIPMTGNDHTILPSPEVDRLYADYGPLFNALRGKKWVLRQAPAQVVAGKAMSNLFQVPGGHLLVVAFAKTTEVTVRVAGPHGAGTMTLLTPGGPARPLRGSLSALRLTPVRGCAVVKIEDAKR